MTAAPSADTLRRLASITGPAYALTDPRAMQAYLSEPRQRGFQGAWWASRGWA